MTKKKLLALIGATVLILAVLVVVSGGKIPWSIPSDDRCDIPDRIEIRPSPSTAAPDGRGLRVVEQGFSQGHSLSGVSLGAMVENTSDSVAYRTQVRFRLFDASHSELLDIKPADLTMEIPILLPGQQIGTGLATYHTEPPAVSMEMDLSATTWISRDVLGQNFSPVSAHYSRTLRFNPQFPSLVDIHYQEKSMNCRSLASRTTVAIFRDAGGKIVGGEQSFPDVPIVFRDGQGNDLGKEAGPLSSPSCSMGERETWIVPGIGQPATADDARTTLYPYCDLPLHSVP